MMKKMSAIEIIRKQCYECSSNDTRVRDDKLICNNCNGVYFYGK